MSNKRGTGLISVIVSIAILAIALTAAASAFMTASRLTKHAACVTTASNFAESIMEHVRSQRFGSIKTTNLTIGLPNLPQAKCEVTVIQPEPGMKEITVVCSWAEGNTPHFVRFSTLTAGGERK